MGLVISECFVIKILFCCVFPHSLQVYTLLLERVKMGSLHQCLNEKRYHQFIYLVRLKSNLNELDDKLQTPLIKICNSMDNTMVSSVNITLCKS